MSDVLERLTAALADRYAIQRELGRGGMATVYLAEDTKLERKVAIKVLKPELAAVLGKERFLREVKITAKLEHPHILGLYDSGEADGFLYYVMPYVEGESLRDRLDREKQLPIEDAIDIARNVAAALSHAHSHGVLHRDIKPENILLSGGEAVLADFGIATAIAAAGGERLTGTGIAIGTPAYMSPEQSSGEQDLDARSDIYALGCVTYEVLTGEPPYTGPSAQAVIAKRLSEAVPSPRVVRETIPDALDNAIRKALAKTPADRFVTASEFADALKPVVVTPATGSVARAAPSLQRRVGLVAAAVVALAAVAWGITRTGGSADADGTALVESLAQRSIAVLPFDDMSADQDQEYMSDGIAEELLNLLARIPELRVISRTSAFSFKGQNIDIPTIAVRLNVAHVLEGSVRKAGNTIRITAQLIDAQADQPVWSHTYDRALDDIFAIQDEIAAAIVEALRATLGLETAPVVRERQVVSAEAYVLYLRGLQAYGSGTTAAYRSARSYFEQAIALEPTYAAAHARLSRALLELRLTSAPEVPSDLVREAANEAIRLDSTLGLPYTVLSMIEEREGRALQELTLELRAKAYALAPNDPYVTMEYGRALEARGRMPESVPLMRKAVELDPLDVFQRAVYGMFLTLRGRPTEGMRELERAIEIDPGNRESWRLKGRASWVVGDLVSSIEAYHMAHELDPEYLGARFIASNYLSLGDLKAARTWMDEAMRRGAPQDVRFEAWYLLLNGQGGEALEWALREFDAQGAPYIHTTLMQIVVGDMIARDALGEAERFLLRYEDGLADFVAGPVQSHVGFGSPGDVSTSYAIALQDVYKRTGRTAEADALADRLDFSSMQGRLSTTQLGWLGNDYRTEALWHMRGGRHSEALAALERVVELGWGGNWQHNIRDHSVFEDLRETPRFRALIETIETDMARQREILAERTAAWVEELAARGSDTAPRN